MPKITIRVPHQIDPVAAFPKVEAALQKTVADFQGHDLTLTKSDTSAQFSFKSMAFTIKGKAEATPQEVVVEVDLPFAAMMFKDKAERAIHRNIVAALR
ncbi:MAG: polyhydroxyalkanoic acid system family protein [Pirellulaceae bacterium]